MGGCGRRRALAAGERAIVRAEEEVRALEVAADTCPACRRPASSRRVLTSSFGRNRLAKRQALVGRQNRVGRRFGEFGVEFWPASLGQPLALDELPEAAQCSCEWAPTGPNNRPNTRDSLWQAGRQFVSGKTMTTQQGGLSSVAPVWPGA